MRQSLLITFLLLPFLSGSPLTAQSIVQDGWFHLDGEKAFLKCIGYETHTRPGQAPWLYSFDANLIAADLERIKQAGFNTIRTWGALTEEELQVVEASGLKILFGIWIEPEGRWGGRGFRLSASNLVRSVLRYSKKYSSIIGYLIMNEPPLDHIRDEGAAELAGLWQTVVEVIHQEHPGVPVSVSFAAIHDFVRTDIFDFAGYNTYIYNPATITYSHGYQGFVDFLKRQRAPSMPLVVTEYGLSVSPGTTALQYGYGGNTLQEQAEGNLLMYRGMIDGGAQGGCVFQYHDGWWKAGNEDVHDLNPEEWFGLVHFDDDSGPLGTPRPAWEAFAIYNKAIVTLPKNGEVYMQTIPVEFFVETEVARAQILHAGSIVHDVGISSNHHRETIELPAGDLIEDVELLFLFFDASMDTLKTETITLLNVQNDIDLPEIRLSIDPDELTPGSSHSVSVEGEIPPPFSVAQPALDYVVHPHIGFETGSRIVVPIPANASSFETNRSIGVSPSSIVTTFAAGLTVEFGAFSRRLYAQEIRTAGDWAAGLAHGQTTTSAEPLSATEYFALGQNYPNPFSKATRIEYTLSAAETVSLSVFDLLGRTVSVLVDSELPPGRHTVSTSLPDVPSGVYVYRLSAGKRSASQLMTVLR